MRIGDASSPAPAAEDDGPQLERGQEIFEAMSDELAELPISAQLAVAAAFQSKQSWAQLPRAARAVFSRLEERLFED